MNVITETKTTLVIDFDEEQGNQLMFRFNFRKADDTEDFNLSIKQLYRMFRNNKVLDDDE